MKAAVKDTKYLTDFPYERSAVKEGMEQKDICVCGANVKYILGCVWVRGRKEHSN